MLDVVKQSNTSPAIPFDAQRLDPGGSVQSGWSP